LSLEKIKEIANGLGNDDLLEAIKGVDETISNNVNLINSLEKDLNKSIEKRDRQAKLVRDTLGVSEITEDSLKAFGSDDTLRAENENLMNVINTLKDEKDTLSNKYNETTNKYMVEKELIKLGATNDVASSKAYDILLSEITSNASFGDGGELLFKSSDGTTIRNADGSPMKLEDRYKSITENDDMKFLFKSSKPKSGSGSNGGKGGSNPTSLDGMNDVERTRLYKSNPELFKSLLNK